MKSIWHERDRRGLVDRLDRLGAEKKPLWGKMGPAEVLVHLADPMRNAMGGDPVCNEGHAFS